jgi:hypothetical protein
MIDEDDDHMTMKITLTICLKFPWQIAAIIWSELNIQSLIYMNTPDNMYLQFQKVEFHYDIDCIMVKCTTKLNFRHQSTVSSIDTRSW